MKLSHVHPPEPACRVQCSQCGEMADSGSAYAVSDGAPFTFVCVDCVEGFDAVPSIDSFYFTAGRRYPIRRIWGWRNALATILCNNGHEKIIGVDGRPSAHLWIPEDYARGDPGTRLGHFDIYPAVVALTAELRL